MQFVTTDQRIAVENFEIGLIYTVTFTSGRYFLGACIGKGADFVMFQRTAPELIFSLTMAAAADVASIEPLSEDIGQILEYTGSVPVSIKTDGSPLLDYLITGNTLQSGTPTLENPIFPQSCGELDSGQYKIPISSAGQTTPVYLSEVESTRRIRKYEFTGQEANLGFYSNSPSGVGAYIQMSDMMSNGRDTGVCTHFTPYGYPASATADNITFGAGNSYIYIIFSAATATALNLSDLASIKSYLQQQYAAGTPVCVWYILAEPTTAIVNEPIRKIGDYADTLSFRQSGVNVPTADGLNIFDIDTTVKPSEVYLKYFSPL